MQPDRRLIASGCLGLAFALALAIAALPGVKADGPAIVVAVVLPAIVIARAFGRVDTLALLFHLNLGIEGAGLGVVKNQILQAMISVAVIVTCFHGLASLWQWRAHGSGLCRRFGFGESGGAVRRPRRVSPGCGVATGATDAPPPAPATHDPGDVVVIFLEGLDRQFADPAVWGDIYAPLTTLAAEGLSLTGVRQITGTGWSIAGMIAALCGVPALPSGLAFKNTYNNLPAFMPSITCLGDVLQPMGYSASFLGTADIGFAGIDAFYRDHGLEQRLGRAELSGSLPADMVTRARVDWVIDDHALMAAGRAVLSRLTTAPAPYLVVLETTGPHGAEGYLAHNCSDSGRAEVSVDTAAVVGRLARETLAFVRHAQAEQAIRRPNRPPHLLILSDHLSHNGTATFAAPAYQGANTVIFLGPNVPPARPACWTCFRHCCKFCDWPCAGGRQSWTLDAVIARDFA